MFSFLVSGLVALSTWAIPAQPGTFTVRQSDGTVITLRINRLLTPTARTPYSGIYDSRAITPSTTPESLSNELLER